MKVSRLFLVLCLITMLTVGCRKGDNMLIPVALSDGALSQYHVISIAFDKKGIAYLGTLNQGLVKFDGVKAVVYNSTNSVLGTAAIWDLEFDQKGNLWIGTDDLIKFDGTTFNRFDAKNFGLPRNGIFSLAVDQADNIWFSCSSFRSGGLVKYDGKTFSSFTPENSSLPGNLIQSIAIDKSNRIWLAINDGVNSVSLVRMTGDHIEVFGKDEIGFAPYYFGNIVVNSDNEVITSLDYGLSSTIAAGRPQMFTFNGTKSGVISLPDENTRIYQTHRIFIDRQNRLWASFRGQDEEYGIYVNDKWYLNDLGKDGIFAFAQKDSGEVWLGTAKGVYVVK